MAKKRKPVKTAKPDPGFLVRLPTRFRRPVEELTTKNHRTITVEFQLAMIEWLKANGIEPPKGK